jgi:hypothetical protein
MASGLGSLERLQKTSALTTTRVLISNPALLYGLLPPNYPKPIPTLIPRHSTSTPHITSLISRSSASSTRQHWPRQLCLGTLVRMLHDFAAFCLSPPPPSERPRRSSMAFTTNYHPLSNPIPTQGIRPYPCAPLYRDTSPASPFLNSQVHRVSSSHLPPT